MGPFDVVSDGSAIPVLAFKMKDPSKYTAFHVSDQLRMGGWQVPAYTMPENATDVAVLRIVVREGLGMDLADSLLEAIAQGGRPPRAVPAAASRTRAWLQPHVTVGP